MATKTKTRAERAADKRITTIYNRDCSGIEIPLLQVLDIFKVGRRAIEAGADDAALAKAITDYVATIRTN